uniref:Ubiquitin like modifier activating enzyme 7 n=1 Tax=Canis lupus dingo TaxID=286419 RepID=A0A8C0L8F9_CANLU
APEPGRKPWPVVSFTPRPGNLVPICTSYSEALASASTASHTVTLSISTADCCPASGLRMDVLETSKLVDEELYSRQLYVLDMPAMQRIREAKVLLSGLQGLGAEVAKNLVLMGVGSLTLHDPHPTCWSDLAAQFFLSEQDLETSRAEASRELVAKLNKGVQVSVHTGDITEELLLGFQVVVLTTSKLEEQLKVGTLCHELGICFLVADTRGLVGQLFCDFGEDFTVQDPTEAEPLTAGSPGILTLRKETDDHYFCDGDLVTFSGIEGMVELNGCDPRPIRVQEDGTLEIGNTATFSRYLRGGAVTEVKRPKTVSHKPLAVALLQPRIVAQSPQEVHRAQCLHQAFRALHQFQHLHGRLPKPWDPVDAEMVVGLARSLEPLKGTKGEPLDEALVKTVALSSAGGLSPMAATMGAVAAQEVLKAISRKFMPLDQWLYFDALDCLPEDGEPLPKPEDCAPRGCRYDGQIAVFGAGFQEKLSWQHYLLVGAGAIGCELLKSFALVGLGAGPSGGVTVADMDHVEHSNLSRQFLFTTQDIGRLKAEVAAEATHRLNSDLQVTPLTMLLDPTTEHIFGDNFFSRVDGVAAALDSFQARKYVAARCTHYLKPLLEAGTQGTMGHASVFMPHVTEAYRAPTSTLASEETTYPVCTLRYFPSRVEHTVQWARNKFEGLFCLSAETINHNQVLTSLAETDGPQVLTLLQEVLGILRERPQTWQDCVLWALGHWQLCFCYSIMQLLNHFPPDKVLEDGTLFWSGPKQCPQPLEFDANQDTHLLYVLAAANLYAQMHGLPGSRDQTALRGLLKLLPFPLWGHVVSHGEELWGSVNTTVTRASQDNDSNFHMDFVAAAASLRAQNYGILPANRSQSKRIVGKIIPAIATTTAAVAGLVGLELYKVVGRPRPLSAFRHCFLHLAENRFNRWVPFAPAIQKAWCFLGSTKNRFYSGFGTLWSMPSYSAYHCSPSQSLSHLPLPHTTRVTELVQQVTGWIPKPGQRVLVLELSCEGEDEDTTFPPLHYEL